MSRPSRKNLLPRRTHLGAREGEAYQKAKAGWQGFQIGMLGGAAKGAALGTLLCPGLGAGIGAFVGMLFGGSEGLKDQSIGDNWRTAKKSGLGILESFAGAIRRP